MEVLFLSFAGVPWVNWKLAMDVSDSKGELFVSDYPVTWLRVYDWSSFSSKLFLWRLRLWGWLGG